MNSQQDLAAALARLDALINWERRDRAGGNAGGPAMRVDVGPARDLLNRAANPQRRFRSVHVAGTKGKGSVSALIEAALARAGLRVGRFASPHVERVNERVTFNCVEITDDVLAAAITRVLQFREDAIAAQTAAMESTWFDVLTVAAFLAFADQNIEWAIVECGIGGRLDSTNTIDAEVCVITNIGLEHTAILGTTLRAIAREKAGILKLGTTLVTAVPGDTEAGQELTTITSALGCASVVVTPGENSTIRERNSLLAGAALNALGERAVQTRQATGPFPAMTKVGAWLLDEPTVNRARLPGRMERFDLLRSDHRPSRPVILDGAHVPFNLEAVLCDLTGIDDLRGPCVVVIALGRDKDASGMLRVLRHLATSVICTATHSGPPAHSPEDLRSAAEQLGMSAEVREKPEQALLKALQLTEDQGWILVTGSLHLVGALRPKLRQ